MKGIFETEYGAGSYSAAEVCVLGGITYRQLDYWDRTDLLNPSMKQANGSGTSRRYSAGDVEDVQMIKALLDAGVRLEYIRQEGPTRTAEKVVKLISKALRE